MRTLIAGLALLAAPALADPVLYIPDRLFDGTSMHSGWQLLTDGTTIKAVGPSLQVPPGTRTVRLQGDTLLPG
jgi:hypothetical protein